MSNRSQAERRKGQIERAVRGGDLDAIRALVDTSPHRAAAALLSAASASGVETDSTLFVELVLATSGKLRALGRFDLAFELVSCVKVSDERTRLERALAAFGNHDDVSLLELVATDANLASLFEPCLAILQNRALPKAPAGALSMLRGLYGICRCAAAITQKKPAQLRTAITAIPKGHAHALRVIAWRYLGKALTTRWAADASEAARALVAMELFQHQPMLKASLGWELGRQHPELLQGDVVNTNLELGPELVSAGRLAALTPATDPLARLQQLLNHGDLQQLSEPDRALAVLCQGYLQVSRAPAQALETFERALAMGADLTETLRGRWLAAQACCRAPTGSTDRADKRAEQSTASLLHALERDADSEALRTLLLIALGMFQERAENPNALKKPSTRYVS